MLLSKQLTGIVIAFCLILSTTDPDTNCNNCHCCGGGCYFSTQFVKAVDCVCFVVNAALVSFDKSFIWWMIS
eukprot:m.126066 g.126066  ORF g.126066 m.126066 type:complete len:72 (+) comp12988_c6_seq2:561-776(+)